MIGLKPDLQGTYVYMTDNALLESMSVADYHFLPNRPLLTTLGKQRLYRLAALVEEYGGEIRFNTTLRDERLFFVLPVTHRQTQKLGDRISQDQNA